MKNKKLYLFIPAAIILFAAAALAVNSRASTTLGARLSGYLLLQVQDHGKIWYVNPADLKRYRLNNPSAVFEAVKKFGLGINNQNLFKLQIGDAGMVNRLKGKFLIQVENHGQAYYVCPKDGLVKKITYNSDAFNLFERCSLGITNENLNKIPIGSLSANYPTISGCQIFPSDNAWNADISRYPLNPKSSTYINAINSDNDHLHADFGENQTYGIPFNVVSSSVPHVPVTFTAYGSESDPGPYPIPASPKIEYGSDRHLLILDSGECKLYELYKASKSGSAWNAESGAIFSLYTNALRPEGWTSSDAAGLPIIPGLVKYDEVSKGVINHAIRFTSWSTDNGWIHPATHAAGDDNPDYPPMGLRVRMKSSYDISGLHGQAKVIATAMKKYGLMLADVGSSWFFQGATDPRWNDADLDQLKNVPGSAFEAVYTGEIHHYSY